MIKKAKGFCFLCHINLFSANAYMTTAIKATHKLMRFIIQKFYKLVLLTLPLTAFAWDVNLSTVKNVTLEIPEYANTNSSWVEATPKNSDHKQGCHSELNCDSPQAVDLIKEDFLFNSKNIPKGISPTVRATKIFKEVATPPPRAQ